MWRILWIHLALLQVSLTTPSDREFSVICRLIYYEQESIEICQKDAYALGNITVNTMDLNDPQWLIFVKNSKICKSIYKDQKSEQV